MVSAFEPTISFEGKQLLVDLLDRNENYDRFATHIQRYTFSVSTAFDVPEKNDDNLRAVVQIMKEFGETTTPDAFPTNSWPWLGYLPTALQWWRPRAVKYYENQRGLWLGMWENLKAKAAAGAAPSCFAQRLLETQDIATSDLQASFLAGTMIEAGLDTSAGALNLLILFFMANPQAQQRVAEQVRQVVGQDRLPSAVDLARIPLIRSSVKEIFRIAPLMKYGTPHYVTRDIQYKSFNIPRGNFVVINQNALHFDESHFPEPFTFIPDRYLGHPEGAGHYAHSQDPNERDHYNFGAGRRICPGIHLAELSIELTLARILWAFDIVEPGHDEQSPGFKITDGHFVDGANKAAKPFQANFRCRSHDMAELIRKEWKMTQAKDLKVL
ncbi:hypothetical protein N0V82_000806 [Gnomoniopsis sp. IMI 355080]|nr:hypothetical protein N0V82_000806 [Gnomoniopsis sp. IMI 355080]